MHNKKPVRHSRNFLIVLKSDCDLQQSVNFLNKLIIII